jgi:ATP-dependent DNA helicase RecG
VLGIQVPTLREALQSGEGQRAELKRGVSDDDTKSGGTENELLKSIAAFANTNDGVIFIGIDDAGRVKGLELDFKRKDRLETKIHQLARSRIKPAPPIHIAFEEIRTMTIAKIFVARGEAPLYMLDGVVYFGEGSTDFQAQPDDLRRLVAEFAF